MLRQSAADFTAARATPASVRERRKSELGYDPAIWREMADLGWLQLAIAEEKGGLGLGFADLCALHEEVGKGALPEPLAAVGLLAAGAVAAAGGVHSALPGLLSGERVATLAWQGAPGAFSATDVTLEAAREGDSHILRGRAVFVPAASGADAFVVAANSGSDVALYWVCADTLGVTLETRKLGDYSPTGDLLFQNVRLDPDALLVGPDRGAAVLDDLLDRGRIAVAAETVGVMHQILTVTLDYLRTREQFGRPIGSFQALQHRAVNLYIQVELARSAVLKAAAAVDQKKPDVPLLAAAAKARASDAAIQVAGQSVHLHGTSGFTEELDLSILIRRAHVLSAWLGNGGACHRRYAALRWPEGIAA